MANSHANLHIKLYFTFDEAHDRDQMGINVSIKCKRSDGPFNNDARPATETWQWKCVYIELIHQQQEQQPAKFTIIYENRLKYRGLREEIGDNAVKHPHFKCLNVCVTVCVWLYINVFSLQRSPGDIGKETQCKVHWWCYIFITPPLWVSLE